MTPTIRALSRVAIWTLVAALAARRGSRRALQLFPQRLERRRLERLPRRHADHAGEPAASGRQARVGNSRRPQPGPFGEEAYEDPVRRLDADRADLHRGRTGSLQSENLGQPLAIGPRLESRLRLADRGENYLNFVHVSASNRGDQASEAAFEIFLDRPEPKAIRTQRWNLAPGESAEAERGFLSPAGRGESSQGH